jgi:pyruvate formate lyase activating enzyme
MMEAITGKVHSFQSLGAVDGPGIRFVVFLQGCNLRCACCHNPDTHNYSGGDEYTAKEIIEKAKRYKEYFRDNGGITLSGGEPLVQATFSKEIFKLAHLAGINTCLDTSGSIFNDEIKELLSHTDRVLLDIKYTTDSDYRKYVGCSLDAPLSFLDYLSKKSIKTTLRQVIIPSLNDSVENILVLKKIASSYPCVDSVELLPFRKVCEVKYEALKIPFPLSHIPEPTDDTMKKLNKILDFDN